jgi:hypothetical protein
LRLKAEARTADSCWVRKPLSPALIPVVLMAMLAGLLVFSQTGAAASIRECGSVGGPGYGNYNITARKMACRDARGISRLFYRDILRTPSPGHPYTWRGFRVRSRYCGVECTDVRLANGTTGEVVRWQSRA